MSNLTKLISRGNVLVQQGDLIGARTILEKAVRDHGRSAEPWISLAAVYGMSGEYDNALRCALKAATLAPHSLQAWINLANAAQSCGDFAQAAKAWGHAHGLPGCPPDVSLHIGLAYVQSGNWVDAAQSLREYCSHNPGHREATLALGSALARLGEVEQSISLLEIFCQRNPEDIHALTQLGFVYLAAGRAENARHAYERASAASPDQSETLFLKGALLMFEGRYEEARDVYEQLMRLQGENPSQRLFTLAAQACRQTGDLDASLAYARTAVRISPHSIGALATLSTVLLTRDPVEARKWMEEAIAIAPNDPAVLTLKGTVLEFEGNKQGAWDAVQAAFEAGSLDPSAATVAAAVAPAVGKVDEVIGVIERLADQPEMAAGERRKLYFTLAKLCDKSKQYDKAFKYAAIANRLKNAWYDHNTYKVDHDRLKAVYSRDTIDSLPKSHNLSELPIFIVGMPRSGTSLLEQILSCHSRVHARGETTDIGAFAAQIPYYPDGVRNLTQQKLDAAANAYIQCLREMAPSASRVTDKMPGNYTYLGLINQLLPGARIINCRRDPRDICLSHFMIEFGRGLTYAYNLESTARVCQLYLSLMEHWKSVLSIPILDVRYEDLIADPHTWVSKVLDFCGLEWEDACLNFHKSKRTVVTASYDQVKKPLYSTSVARWKNYHRHLEPVSRILGLHDDTYP